MDIFLSGLKRVLDKINLNCTSMIVTFHMSYLYKKLNHTILKYYLKK